MGKLNIIFIDDDIGVLEGLENSLYKQRKEWNMSFVDNALDAYKLMEQEPFDVVISDMRMPEIDGATLLTEVKEKYPSTVRMILSGHSDLKSAMKSVSVAHQFLTKPCDVNELRLIVERACQLQGVLSDPRLRTIVGKISMLPPSPKIYNKLIILLQKEDIGLDEIAQVIEQDIAISSKLLQLVNSGFFGLGQRITTICHALSYLGIIMVKNLIFSLEVYNNFEDTIPENFNLKIEQQHGMNVALIAREILEDKQAKDDAFIAGILHDVGKLVIASCLPDLHNKIIHSIDEYEMDRLEVEETLYGISHAEIGGYLLGIWGIPYNIVEAVTYHHNADNLKSEKLDVIIAIYLANCLAADLEIPIELIDHLKIGNKLAEWKLMSKELLEKN